MAWLPHHFVIATHTAGPQMLRDCATSTQRPWLHCVCCTRPALAAPAARRKRSMRLASVLPLGAIPFYGSGKLPRHGLRRSTALELSTASTCNWTHVLCWLPGSSKNQLLCGFPRRISTQKRLRAVRRDPVPQPIRYFRGSASRIGLKQQNINKEALQTVRPRTWRSVRSTPHQ